MSHPQDGGESGSSDDIVSTHNRGLGVCFLPFLRLLGDSSILLQVFEAAAGQSLDSPCIAKTHQDSYIPGVLRFLGVFVGEACLTNFSGALSLNEVACLLNFWTFFWHVSYVNSKTPARSRVSIFHEVSIGDMLVEGLSYLATVCNEHSYDGLQLLHIPASLRRSHLQA